MHLSLVNVFISLLAFGQTLGTAYAYPSEASTLLEHDVLLQENRVSKRNNEESLFEKRAIDPPLTNWAQGPGTTWSGFVKQPTNAQWTTDTIDAYVYDAWKQTQSGKKPPPVLVAGLWVQGAGVYLGSIPHGDNQGMSAQVMFDGMLRSQAPILWQKVKDRTYSNTSKWHAEDMAMYVYEREEHPTGSKYPDNSYMFVYGQYLARDKGEPRLPCQGKRLDGSGVEPSCTAVLKSLSIAFGC